MLPRSGRDWEPETGWRPGNTEPTRGHCSPGQHVCFRGATLTRGINSWGRSLQGAVQGLREGWRCRDVLLCLISISCLRGEKKPCFSFPAGGMSLPVSDYLMETQAGSAVTLVGPWVCVTTWCPFTGSFTLKNGLIALATSTTGASRTTGAQTQREKHTASLFPDKSIHSTHCDSYRNASSPPRNSNTHILFA